MVNHKTNKKRVIRSKKFSNTRKKPIVVSKKCVSDDEMGKICSTGQYSTYQGNFYKRPDNMVKFKEVKELFRTNPKYKGLKTYNEKYTAFLKQNFQEGELPKVIHQIKNNFYGYVNDEWFKQNDIEKFLVEMKT